MNVAERRAQIMKLLYRRRHETVANMAYEFGVSSRTIMRDIEALSLTEPIYTQTGRYGGGIYIMDGYSPSAFYFKPDELALLNKLIADIDNSTYCTLTEIEKKAFKDLVAYYTKPDYSGGNTE